MALSLAARDTSTEVRCTILTTTLLLVCFTIWVLGTAADPMLRCLDIRFVLTPRGEGCEPDLSLYLSICQSPSSVFCGLSVCHNGSDRHDLIIL